MYLLYMLQNGALDSSDEISLVLGLPLGASFASNYSDTVKDISEAIVLLWSNFIRNGY